MEIGLKTGNRFKNGVLQKIDRGRIRTFNSYIPPTSPAGCSCGDPSAVGCGIVADLLNPNVCDMIVG